MMATAPNPKGGRSAQRLPGLYVVVDGLFGEKVRLFESAADAQRACPAKGQAARLVPTAGDLVDHLARAARGASSITFPSGREIGFARPDSSAVAELGAEWEKATGPDRATFVGPYVASVYHVDRLEGPSAGIYDGEGRVVCTMEPRAGEWSDWELLHIAAVAGALNQRAGFPPAPEAEVVATIRRETREGELKNRPAYASPAFVPGLTVPGAPTGFAHALPDCECCGQEMEQDELTMSLVCTNDRCPRREGR